MMSSERIAQGNDGLLRSNVSQNYGSTSNTPSRSSSYNEFTSSSPCCPQLCVVSHARRTFCLVVTFDLLLSFLLWSIFVKLKGGDFLQQMLTEFTDYNFKSSLMDYLILAVSRFIILIFSYGLFKLRNPYIMAVATLLTCIYILPKIVLIQGLSYFAYILLGESFIISWVETWFLDFKVLPSESIYGERILDDEEMIGSHRRKLLINDPEGDGFMTPSEGSEDEEDLDCQTKDVEFYKKAKETWKLASVLVENECGWKKENEANGITVHSQQFRGIGKIFRGMAIIEAAAADVFRETTLLCDKMPKWNKSIAESRVLRKINDSMDVMYHVTKDKGIIKSRDFVSVRHWNSKSNDSMLSIATSINASELGSVKPHIRGETKLSAWMYKELPNGGCQLKFLLSIDVKGWVPQKALDSSLSSVVIETIKHLQEHMKTFRSH